MTLDPTTELVVHLKTLKDEGHLDLTWEQMAQIAGLENGEQARGRYRIWESSNPAVQLVSPNNLVLNTIGTKRTISAEDLIALHGIDMEEWKVVKQSVRKWDGFSKIKDQDLSWKDGVLSGHSKSDGKLNLVELSYIRVELVRVRPVQVNPVLPQLQIPDFPVTELINVTEVDHHLVVYIPDPHFPYQDEKVLQAILNFCIENEALISHVIWGGDVLDLRELSTFTNLDDDNAASLSEAIYDAGYWLLRFRRALPNAIMVYLEGNHEKRLRIQLKKLLPALYGLKAFSENEVEFPLISIPTLLGLEKMRVEYRSGYPDGEFYWVKDVAYAHGTLFGRFGTGIVKLLKEAHHDIMTGHDHRIQTGAKTIWDGPGKPREIHAAIVGWTGDIESPPPGRKLFQDWQHGFGITTYYPGGHRLEAVPISNGTFFWGGKLYKS